VAAPKFHGKEGVNGSSPLEGLGEPRKNRGFPLVVESDERDGDRRYLDANRAVGRRVLMCGRRCVDVVADDKLFEPLGAGAGIPSGVWGVPDVEYPQIRSRAS
jgi:hypothetical protein